MANFLRELLPPRHPLRLLWHRGKAAAAALTYAFPARKLVVIGLTGTDGKTTTVGMTSHILHTAGIAAGALSTAQFRIRGDVAPNALQKTSPSPFAIQRFLRRCVRAGCTHVVLECSSHGLVQGRLAWTWPSVAAVTNTTPEHLDYHGTMEQYRKDKGILFRMLRGRGTKILNADDESYALYHTIPSTQTIAYSPTRDASALQATTTSCAAVLRIDNEDHALHLAIPGTFNVGNALCAIACARAVGVPTATAVEALRTFPGIPGRMEYIDEGQHFSVYVDFTVTPEAYRKTLAALRSQLPTGRRLLVLTGSCGDRMREKRPTIGKICSELADVVIVANEDPYTEDPAKIIDEVWAGIDQSKTHAQRIPDRRAAIEFLLQKAEPGDIVLLCGKGSDMTMWTKEGQVPWNERAIARELIRTAS